MICTTYIQTPLGQMLAGATDTGICLFDFQYRKSIDQIVNRTASLLGDQYASGEHPHFVLLRAELELYFSGALTMFTVPLHLVGSPFQLSVWHELLTIPYGQTRSYKQQSIRLGNEKAIRAVAGANGENGIAIMVPCHRVIGTNGSLTGYGGGLQRKQWLLSHERKYSGAAMLSSLF